MLTSDIYFSINLARTLEINPDDQISLTKAFLHNKSQITTVLTANYIHKCFTIKKGQSTRESMVNDQIYSCQGAHYNIDFS